jgi:hypothetical protein
LQEGFDSPRARHFFSGLKSQKIADLGRSKHNTGYDRIEMSQTTRRTQFARERNRAFLTLRCESSLASPEGLAEAARDHGMSPLGFRQNKKCGGKFPAASKSGACLTIGVLCKTSVTLSSGGLKSGPVDVLDQWLFQEG